MVEQWNNGSNPLFQHSNLPIPCEYQNPHSPSGSFMASHIALFTPHSLLSYFRGLRLKCRRHLLMTVAFFQGFLVIET